MCLKTATVCLHIIINKLKKTKTQEIAGVGKDVEKEEHSSTAGGIASWYNTLEISLAVPQKTGHNTSGGPCNTTPGPIPRGFPACNKDTCSTMFIAACSHLQLHANGLGSLD